MARQQLMYGALAVTNLVLVAACDRVENPLGPESAASNPVQSGIRTDVLSAVGPGPMLSAVAANVCAEVGGGTAEAPPNGAPIQVWACHGGANQKLVLQSSGAVTAYDGARCLDVWGAQANDGDKVVAWTCHGGSNQRWTRTAAGELRSAVNGKCLDLWGARGENGAKLVVWSCHGGSNQKWAVNNAVAVSSPAQAFDSALVPTPVTVSTASTIGSAQLPRDSVDTRMPTPTGRTINVGVGEDLQAALDAAQPGDVVSLAAGATFTGNFVLRPKPGMTSAQWITVRGAGALVAAGTRVSIADAAQMPKLLTPNAAPALFAMPATQGWRITGVEIAATPTTSMVYSLVAFGGSGAEQDVAAEVPGRLVLDRSYVHGSATLDVRRCILLNSATSAVIDSYVSECHSRNGDSQAIVGWNGPGPFKILNNRLEGAHENVAFGGADPSVPNLVPSDIEIRRNYVVKPLSWKGVWPAKNLLELKAGRRVLIEANVFENNWVDAQNGFAFLWWSVNAEGRAPWTVTEDITFRSNRVTNVAGGFNIKTGAGSPAPVSLSRVVIADNVITGLNDSNGRFIQLLGSPSGITVANNTGLGVTHDLLITESDQPMPTLVFRNNITGALYNFFVAGRGMGASALSGIGVPASNVTGNLVVTTTPGNVPSGNAVAPSASAVGFVDFAGGDLRLATSSAFRSAGIGSSVPGADVGRLTVMTAGVVR